MKKILLTIMSVVLCAFGTLYAQGSESFTNYTVTGTTYSTGSFVGNDGSTWNYVQCNGDKPIAAPSVMLGRNRSPLSEVTSGTITGGCGILSFDYKQTYTNNVNLQVYVNNQLVATVTSTGEQDILKNSGNITVNIGGNFTLKFAQPSNAGQVTIDNIVWTAYSGPSALSVTNPTRNILVPTSSESINVTSNASGGDKPYTAQLKYTVNGGAEQTVAMVNTTGDVYSGSIPAQANGALVQYYVTVTDNASATETTSTAGLFWGTSPISSAQNSIKEINADGTLKFLGYYARVNGVTTSNTSTFQTANLEVFMQDAMGGICLYKAGAPGGTIDESHNLTVVGKLDIYNGKTEIVPDNFSDIIDHGVVTSVVPMVKTIDDLIDNAELYENMLIKVESLHKTTGTWGANANLTMVQLPNESPTLTLRIDGDAINTTSVAEPRWTDGTDAMTVTGIFTQFDSSSPYTTGYQFLPRSAADFSFPTSTGKPVATKSLVKAENNAIVIEVETISDVKVYSLTGQVAASKTIQPGRSEIAIGKPGVYIVNLMSNGKVQNVKVVVK